MYCSTNRRCKYVIASVCAFTRRPCYSFRVFTRFISLSLSLLASSCKIVKRAQLLAIDYTCEYQILADDKKGREPAAAPLASFLVSSFFRMQIYLKDSMFLSDIYPVRASSSSSSSIESSFSSFGCGRLVNSG